MGAKMQWPGIVAGPAVVVNIATSLSPRLWITDLVENLMRLKCKLHVSSHRMPYDVADKTARKEQVVMTAPSAVPQSCKRKRGLTACTWDVDGFMSAFFVKAN